MRSILYWSALIFFGIFLAYISPFSLTPIIFLGGAILFGVAYFLIAANRRRKGAVGEPGAQQTRFIGSILLYVIVFWTTVGLFSNVKESREFIATYEPYIEAGMPHGYTFFYADYAGKYERVDSPELNRLLEEKKPAKVRMTLEVVKDFGRLRAYTVRSIESIAVDKAWTDGNPPWDALR